LNLSSRICNIFLVTWFLFAIFLGNLTMLHHTDSSQDFWIKGIADWFYFGKLLLERNSCLIWDGNNCKVYLHPPYGSAAMRLLEVCLTVSMIQFDGFSLIYARNRLIVGVLFEWHAKFDFILGTLKVLLRIHCFDREATK
jgi:hypothetical protein